MYANKWQLPISLIAVACFGCSGGAGNSSDNDAGGTVVDSGGGELSDAALPDASPDAAPMVDCSSLTSLPVSHTAITGFSGSEDFAFDKEGNLVSTREGNMTRQKKSGGRTLLSPNVGETAGTRFLSNGDLVVAQVDRGELWKIASDGSTQTILSGLVYPNGVEVDRDGFVYVSELDAGRIRRINPDNGDATIIATGLEAPNGVSFSPDYKTLYVNSFGGGTVHKITVDGNGDWSAPELLGRVPKSTGGGGLPSGGFPGAGGGLDALTVDECGNVYVTEYELGIIWRFSPEGVREKVVELPSFWIPNMHWGSGVGGWDENILYVMDRELGRLFELDLGVREKERVY